MFKYMFSWSYLILILIPISLEQSLFSRRDLFLSKRFLHLIYFRESDLSINEKYLKIELKNLTDFYHINLKITIFDQTFTSLLLTKFCSIISNEQRDTILIADFYTKEIDLISRSLRIPTITMFNRYSIVQGKMHNPYLFKFMADPLERAQSTAYALETRSVFTRIALIYDTSLDMIEYRLSYLRLAKQDIIYRAHLPLSSEFYRSTRKILADLIHIHIDLILCLMSTERELEFLRLIDLLGTKREKQILLNQTSWWFASRIGEIRNLTYTPMSFTAPEDRRRMVNHFTRSNIKILSTAILRTYIRLPMSTNFIGQSNCQNRQSINQLTRTDMFIKLFTNFTEWNCDIRLGGTVDPILFDNKTLTWRTPTIYMIHKEPSCKGMFIQTFLPNKNLHADQLFRSCRTNNSLVRKTLLTINSSNILFDLKSQHQILGILPSNESLHCQLLHLHSSIQTLIIVGVVEQPYIFVSDNEISSEFHCNYGTPCYKIDPLTMNITRDPLFFHKKMRQLPHCCFGISINLLLRLKDMKIISTLKSINLFVFADKQMKWLALIQTLQNHRADFSISPIPYESSLARSIDLTPPFYHSSFVILTMPTPTGLSLVAFLQPFSWATWAMIFVLLNATALFETFFEWYSPYGLTPRGRRRHKVFSLASALTLSWSIIFSHTFKTKSPKCWSNRFLGNVWGGFGIVFVAIYTAKLAAFMVVMGRIYSATTLHDITKICRTTPHCTLGVVPNTTDDEYLKRFYSSTLYRRRKYIRSYHEGIDRLKNYELTYLLMDHAMARYYLTRDAVKLIRISDDDFGRFGLSLGFSKFKKELKENITNILLSYVDKGIIQHLHDHWYVYENCETKLLDNNGELSPDRFFGVFMLLIAGTFVGLIVLLLEWLIFKYAVPYWQKRHWTGWLFFSQRLYAILNVPKDIYNRAYSKVKNPSFRYVGERLHNYTTRRDSVDFHVVNIPKLLSTSCQLHDSNTCELQTRIDQLELELDYLKSKLN